MTLLEFDNAVSGFEEQPVRIHFAGEGGRKKSYVPDILIHFSALPSGEKPKSVLAEVKHTKHLQKYKVEYAPKFEAARLYAEERGWEWRIYTQKDIRTPHLDNIKFLREYHTAEPDAGLLSEVICTLQGARNSMTVESLLERLCQTDERTLLIAPAIWHLVAIKKISANLNKPLSTKTRLSLAGVKR